MNSQPMTYLSNFMQRKVLHGTLWVLWVIGVGGTGFSQVSFEQINRKQGLP